MKLVQIITAADAGLRNRSLEEACEGMEPVELLRECAELEAFRHDAESLYDRVRALFFLYSLCRFHLPVRLPENGRGGKIPYEGYEHFLQRRFEEAIECFLNAQQREGASDALFSALAATYHRLAFQTLANQVRGSVRSVRGNQWMFRVGHPMDHPLRIRSELLNAGPDATYPILHEQTPVRMDLTHSAWSDIFFLGMDFPEGARVLNVSIDLGVHGRDAGPRPPVEAYLRVIDEPVLRLTSVDLRTSADISDLNEVFDYARDYLGLLKAAVIAAGIIPPGLEGSGQKLADVLGRLIRPGLGLELVSNVRGIPKGSRLAVSTNLLGCLISVCMRATGQAALLTGELSEEERRIVAARAILGEWLGGSGGGWQDSGGVWPGMKLIEGSRAVEGDPEWGVSRGRLLPRHHVFSRDEISSETRQKLQDSLVLVHGGMAQNVGPILEMVTEKYLLRSASEWTARQQALRLMDEVIESLKRGDVKELGRLTTRNFRGPIQAIIPWATNLFTETVIQKVEEEFGADFWGFWMLGGMSGGGMGFIFDPAHKRRGQERLQAILDETKRELESSLPFAMQPVVYDFAINEAGTCSTLLTGADALVSRDYYLLQVPRWLQTDRHDWPPTRRTELERFTAWSRNSPTGREFVPRLFDTLLPLATDRAGVREDLQRLLKDNGFDPVQHEQIRRELTDGMIGLSQNRLAKTSQIEDVLDSDVEDTPAWSVAERDALAGRGRKLIREGAVAVVTLAAGAGSRWTQGAGVAKALHPFSKLSGRHRTFIETHLAKSRRRGEEAGNPIPHVFTTSHLTHAAIDGYLKRVRNHGYSGELILSPGRSIGLRMVPTVRDLRFHWEETPQQLLDEQQQKMKESGHEALIHWARTSGEATDYTDNVAAQCLHPVGHWYEVPNLLRNGTLQSLLTARPQLQYLLLHNIDTLGADVDPSLLGWFAETGSTLAYEVIHRRLEDRGGGLARVNGRPRLVEGLAMPDDRAEFGLRFYNSMTTWIHIDRLLDVFGLSRETLRDEATVQAAIRELAARMPTYITLKDVKKRWGQGQEDVFPVTQFEKLWGDMSALGGVDCRYAVVSRARGQQLKDQAQLDGWLRDGSAGFVEGLCQWGRCLGTEPAR